MPNFYAEDNFLRLPHILLYMEVIFSELRQKEVINVSDGKHLGKVCDLKFTFPDGNVLGVCVTGCKGFKLTKQELFVPLKCVTKIGEDAVLVNLNDGAPPAKPQPPQNCPPPCPPCPPPSRRSFDEYE